MSTPTHNPFPSGTSPQPHFDLFSPLRRWLDDIEVKDEKFARFLCGFIPSSCPFERDITLFGRTFHIPALCAINPLYKEIVSLRRRAATFLEEIAS